MRLHHEVIMRGEEAMARLEASSVTVCGAGALGANITEALARAGVGGLRVIDFDRVEEQNLSTQPYWRSDVGRHKARILANTLYRAVGVKIDAQAVRLEDRNVRKLLRGSDLVVDVFDNSPSRRLVKTHCAEAGLECVHAGLGDRYAEVIWNAHYRVPSEAQDDICDYPLARTLVMLATAVTCEVIIRFLTEGDRQDFTMTQDDLCVRPFPPTAG